MPTLASRSSIRTLGALALLGLLAACATPEESALRYDTSRENTQTDARDHVMGDRPRAASQIQLGFGSTGPVPVERAAAPGAESTPMAAAAAPRPLAEPRSFLGTVPCPSGMTCEAARFTVTLAPSGEWRSRTQLLVGNQVRQTLTGQGCWDVIGDRPLRIALLQQNRESTLADLSFVNDNSLRVNMLNGETPVLEHRLSRQADLDPIDELKDRPAISCN